LHSQALKDRKGVGPVLLQKQESGRTVAALGQFMQEWAVMFQVVPSLQTQTGASAATCDPDLQGTQAF